MSSRADHHVEYHLLYKIINAAVRTYPFPHIYVEDVFPADFYRDMTANFPAADEMRSIEEERNVPKGLYPERYILTLSAEKAAALPESRRPVWQRVSQFLLSAQFGETLLWKFSDVVKPRLQHGTDGLSSEILLVDDRENYSIGPHTDNPSKVLTALFYLPAGDTRPEIGTSIYLPNNPNFRCPGGPSHPVEQFQRVVTMPYKPNALFAFAKTDFSFHGVERVSALQARRQLMIYDVYLRSSRQAPARPVQAAAEPTAPKVTFSF
jgi:hypothetical protein